MTTTANWSAKRFPLIYDGDKPTGVIIDLRSFAQIELVMENLLNREAEPEDDLLTQSANLQHIAHQVLATAEPLIDWEKSLNEL